MFGKSYVVGVVLRLLLGMAQSTLSEPGLKDKVRNYVYDVLPGDWMDPLAWALIDAVWDTLLAYAMEFNGDNSLLRVTHGVAAVAPKAEEFLAKVG